MIKQNETLRGPPACKSCSKCGKLQPLSFFIFRNDSRKLRNDCKSCTRKRSRKWMLCNSERSRKNIRDWQKRNPIQARAWSKANPEKVKETGRKMKRIYPEKNRSRNTLYRWVLKGSIIRPTICSKCGKGGRIEGHHRDYSKPLEVSWLCNQCHADHHRASREAKILEIS